MPLTPSATNATCCGTRPSSARPSGKAHVIDGLMHNEVVKSDIHSTDAFGFSELVFAVSHLLGFSYAPASRTSGASGSIFSGTARG
ncbi:MAG: Tn3 family transposase [Verrucomicrobia bacterium]|nr:Tn3 family transposase [Verrucomicrobiota bacterium]